MQIKLGNNFLGKSELKNGVFPPWILRKIASKINPRLLICLTSPARSHVTSFTRDWKIIWSINASHDGRGKHVTRSRSGFVIINELGESAFGINCHVNNPNHREIGPESYKFIMKNDCAIKKRACNVEFGFFRKEYWISTHVSCHTQNRRRNTQSQRESINTASATEAL